VRKGADTALARRYHIASSTGGFVGVPMGVRLAKLTGRRQVIARWIGDGRSGHNGGEQRLQGAGLQRAERSTIGRRADRHDELITPFVARDARVQLCKTFKAAVRVSRSLFVAAKPRSRQHSSARAFRPVVPYFVEVSRHIQSSGRAQPNRAVRFCPSARRLPCEFSIMACLSSSDATASLLSG